ncbi:metalloprotease [Coemansia aciculifera]|uniref:Metalloprotease n=1 Tax=Coemansia aciculifera TaxID=417176 RepID=A0A9W8IE63_9FUNG|nr:metalloprotease [Coemansia aciculifera]
MDFCKNYPLPDWTSGFEHRKTTASQLPYEEYTGPMDKSAGDTNDYKLIRLPNNLVVMCVQDPATETAAAALSVNVGSNMDPVELQGLAHFLEHMLFMGTEKYPNEDEYKTYISEHSGSYNASTSFSRTRYHFGIANDAFEGALDRLSSFFTSPLFKKDCVDRELCAVDSEYKGLLNSDFWRSHQIGCKLSDPDHPYSKFMVGNIEVLKQGAKDHGLDLYEELLKFYNKYYSSDIMKLVICGNHSLDQLVEWAVSKFSDIKSKGDNVQRDLGHPVNAEFLGKVIHIETVDDMHTMSMHFPVPDTKAMYRSDPFDYISHFLGYKGQGSIIAYLKQQGWATSLSVGSDTAYNSGFCEFGISISATPEGLEHYEDILRSVFAYLRMLISSGPQEWAQQEKSSMLKIGFDNRTKTRALVCVLGYTHLIHNEYVAPEHVLSKDSAYEKFNYDDILHCLSFINPDNFRVFLCAAKHKSIECSEVEPYFGGAYHVDSLSVDLIRELASDTIHVDGLSLPERNLFIPDDFSIKSTNMLGVAAVLRPTLLKLNDNFELWFKQDDQFNSPKGSISLCIYVLTINSSPQNRIMSELYCDMLNSKLLEDLHNFIRAGQLFAVFASSTYIDMGVVGYSNKLSDLFAIILERLKSFKVDNTQLSMHIAKYKQRYANAANDSPSQLCAVYERYITGTSEWHHQLLESELAKITPAKLQAHIDSLFDVTYTKMCMVGNFDEAEALKVSDDVQAVIKPTPNLGYNLSKPRSYDIEPGYYIYQMQVPNEDCVNSAVLSNIYCGPTTDKREAAMLEILETLVHDGFFAQLRTKHQLGYKVSASCEIFPVGRSELALRVESESNPMYVTLHINKFIHDMQQRLLDMTDEQFNNRVQSLVMQYQEGVKNISHEAGKYSFEVKTGTYNFGKNIAMANLLQSIAKEELLAFWNKYINPSTAPAYTRIDVQTWSTKIWKPSVSDIKTYSAKTLALYGCLHSEGNDALDIGKVDEFITAAIATRKKQPEASDSTDTLLADLKSASMSASGAMYTAGESAERATHTGTALELAIKGHGTFGNYANVSHTNFATIGMDKTPDGLWLMTDYRKFQATQKMYGSELPAEVLVPKYNS